MFNEQVAAFGSAKIARDLLACVGNPFLQVGFIVEGSGQRGGGDDFKRPKSQVRVWINCHAESPRSAMIQQPVCSSQATPDSNP